MNNIWYYVMVVELITLLILFSFLIKKIRKLARLNAEIRPKQKPSERAHELLLEHLSKEQRSTLESSGYFVERVPWVPGRLLRRRLGITSREKLIFSPDYSMIKGKRWRYCIHVDPYATRVPRDDELLAILLTVRHDPEEFYRIADQHY